jgi:hypothetical protein
MPKFEFGVWYFNTISMEYVFFIDPHRFLVVNNGALIRKVSQTPIGAAMIRVFERNMKDEAFYADTPTGFSTKDGKDIIDFIFR